MRPQDSRLGPRRHRHQASTYRSADCYPVRVRRKRRQGKKPSSQRKNELLSWREGEKGVCFLQPVISFERCCALFGAESVAFQPPFFQDVTANLSVFLNNRDLYLRTVSLVCILVIFRFSRLLGIICLSHPRCRSHDKNSHAYNATITANRAGNSRVKLWVITLRGSSSPAVVIFFSIFETGYE